MAMPPSQLHSITCGKKHTTASTLGSGWDQHFCAFGQNVSLSCAGMGGRALAVWGLTWDWISMTHYGPQRGRVGPTARTSPAFRRSLLTVWCKTRFRDDTASDWGPRMASACWGSRPSRCASQATMLTTTELINRPDPGAGRTAREQLSPHVLGTH